MAEGAGGHAPNFFEIVGFPKILMLQRKLFGILLLVKIKVSNFIGKSLNLPLSTLQVPQPL